MQCVKEEQEEKEEHCGLVERENFVWWGGVMGNFCLTMSNKNK